ncbi:MAG: hypothetical protein U9O94_02615, partial [Nanoarchaeota archaeon]|nr:hypothetical protein [Nanoarchaeota archaeon]
KEEKKRKEEEKKIKEAEKLKLKEDKKKTKEKISVVKILPIDLKIKLGKYETDIDVLYKIIERSDRIKLSAISGYFGIDKTKAEQWIRILEEHDLAKLHYPTVGEPELRKISKEE